jgi:hypothetical protein
MVPSRPTLLPRPVYPEHRGQRFALISTVVTLGITLVWATFHMVLTVDLTRCFHAAPR